MNRIDSRSDFSLRMAFHDNKGMPVSMKNVDFDLWFATRALDNVYLAAQQSGVTNNCQILDDGSVLVHFDRHNLAPGQLTATLRLHIEDHDLPDGSREIEIKPAIPIELTDARNSMPTRSGSCHQALPCSNHDPSHPVLVNIRIPWSNPDLTTHVTRQQLTKELDELRKENEALRNQISELQGMSHTPPGTATDDQIDNILSNFRTDDSKE